jgi:pimeloyl-ACP methyl ester carboxylesterase
MEILRTPDERFENLPGYSFDPHYVDDLPGYADLRMHYVDIRPTPATGTVLCLHGQPTWSYLYRKMIPIFAGAGHRVVAPDLFGFGRSDKPTDDGVYTFAFHLESVRQFIVRLNLRDVTLVCQDWGGILGLAVVPGMPERFSRLVVMNTFIPTGRDLGEGFSKWREYNRSRPDLDVGRLLQRAVTHLSDAEAAAYDAPFPDARYKAGVRRFPELVPADPSMPGAEEGRRARTFWRRDWQGQSFMAIGMRDPVIPPAAMTHLRTLIRGCPAPLELPDAGHFVQEHGDVVARAALTAFSGSAGQSPR